MEYWFVGPWFAVDGIEAEDHHGQLSVTEAARWYVPNGVSSAAIVVNMVRLLVVVGVVGVWVVAVVTCLRTSQTLVTM